MITCLNCRHKEVSGAVFCSQCGAQLVTPVDIDTLKINTAGTGERIKGNTAPYQPPPPTTLNSWVSLHMVESGQILPLADRTEFTLGRTTEGQPIMPDVDLSPFNAYANGVSRLHAVLKCINKHTIIMDLGSSNGTYVNGSRVTPNMEHPVAHGDIVYLGKLKIQVLFGQENRTN
jgi:hypothetical protein